MVSAQGRHRLKNGDEADTAPDAAPTTLLGRASQALVWSFVNTVVSRLGTLGIGIVLARVLGPKDFGTYAVAYVALIAVLSFNELGVSLAIVRWPGDPRAIAPTVSTISVAASAIITAASFLAAPAFSSAMGDPSATPVVRLLGLSVLLSGLVATPAALLEREFQQGRRAIVDQVNTWVGALVSIALALTGMGAMSLAVGRLAGGVVSGVLFIRFSPHALRFGFDRDQVRPLLRFGLPLAGSSIVVFAVGYLDQLVAGRVLGSVVLGFYVLAFNLSNWPVGIFSLPLRNVAPPTFARLQHEPDTMRAAFRSLVGLLARVTFPICLVIAGASHPIIAFVYGPQWAPAASALRWLAVLAAFKILFELTYDYLVVLGASGSILVLQVTTLVALIPTLIVGASVWGIQGLAAAQVLVAAVVILPLYLVRFRRVGLSTARLARRLAPPALASIAVAVLAAGLDRTVHSSVLVLVLSGAATLAVVAALLRVDRGEVQALRAAIANGSRVEQGADL